MGIKQDRKEVGTTAKVVRRGTPRGGTVFNSVEEKKKRRSTGKGKHDKGVGGSMEEREKQKII